MSRAPLSERDRRALALGALVLVPALLFTFVARPFAGALAERRDRLAAERALLERELALLADARTFPGALREAEAELLGEAPRLFAGPDPLVATGVLEGHVIESARRSRVFLQRSEALAPESAGPGVVALRLAVRAAGDLEGVLAFLRALEGGPRLVRIDRLSLERVENLDRGADPVVIALTAALSGYAVAGAEPAAAPARRAGGS